MQCFFPQYAVQTMQTPIFFMKAVYDSRQKSCKLDLKKCTPRQLKIIQDFRAQMLSALSGGGRSSSRGMFIDSSYAHCQAGKQVTWSSDGSPAVRAIVNSILSESF
ncbi:Pectinacetylesterase [Corchorus olitorius]|uniref:Pectin acetylesterase n=1 Tax=Corchorus olitorius TaxID=93759 RepID=A0A1R3I7J2_9ROSI|nr:Pectinacetylesterase [Corchorus olitorius]